MSLLNIFKKKERKEEELKKAVKKSPSLSTGEKSQGKGAKEDKEAAEKKKQVEKGGSTKKLPPKKIKGKKSVSGFAYRVLEYPHITEKATNFSEKNKYVFKVTKEANKTEIKKAINDVYGVDVVDVKIINVHRRKRKMGRQTGWKKGYKKAIVKVKEGQKIELLSR